MADRVCVRLEGRAVLELGGEDRRTFLQGLISNDVNKVDAGHAIWAALLTPQGKFLHDLFIVEAGERFLIDAEAARIEELKKKLSIYKLRAKVTLGLAQGLVVCAIPGEGALAALGLPAEAGAALERDGGVVYVDPRLPALGARAILPETADLGLPIGSFADWDRTRLVLGVPDGSRDLPIEKAILLENGFDELKGVDFNKGCYMGQELTSRTKYRGLVRKRLMPVSIDGPTPEAGTAVMTGETEAGEMRSANGNLGVALIRLEHFRAGAPLTCGGAKLTPKQPAWAVFPEGD
ncbi:MAG: YgfZ/GcvT domain-containing protein [Actinomycetota bacterium]